MCIVSFLFNISYQTITLSNLNFIKLTYYWFDLNNKYFFIYVY